MSPGQRIAVLTRRLSLEEAKARALFADGSQGILTSAFTNFQYMFQDTAGTIPVTAVNQSVGKVLDISGRGNHIAFYNVTVKSDGTRNYLAFNGTSSYFVTPSINLSTTDKLVFCAGWKVGASAVGVSFEFGTNVNSVDGTFAFAQNDNAASKVSVCARAVSATDARTSPSSYSTGTKVVVSAALDLSQAARNSKILPRYNGAVPTLTGLVDGADTAGNFANVPLYGGARAGTSTFANMDLYGFALVGKDLTASEILGLEALVNQNTGAY